MKKIDRATLAIVLVYTAWQWRIEDHFGHIKIHYNHLLPTGEYNTERKQIGKFTDF